MVTTYTNFSVKGRRNKKGRGVDVPRGADVRCGGLRVLRLLAAALAGEVAAELAVLATVSRGLAVILELLRARGAVPAVVPASVLRPTASLVRHRFLLVGWAVRSTTRLNNYVRYHKSHILSIVSLLHNQKIAFLSDKLSGVQHFIYPNRASKATETRPSTIPVRSPTLNLSPKKTTPIAASATSVTTE